MSILLIATFLVVSAVPQGDTASAFASGRFTVSAYPPDHRLARALLADALARDTFPGLPRSSTPVVVRIAPDERRFRDWIGPSAPEWGAAVAFPGAGRIVMQGRSAGSDAGDPLVVLRHELAHLALHDYLGDLATHWFHEGYASFAAGEWSREEVLATNVLLVTRGFPTLRGVDSALAGGAQQASGAYALAHRAVAELAALDPRRGLSLFLRYWKESGSLERAVRQAYGLTLSGFELHWRQRTRRRYGGLALFADLGLAALVTLALTLPLWIARRRRDRKRLAALLAAEAAAEKAAREDLIAQLLGTSVEPAGDDDRTEPAP